MKLNPLIWNDDYKINNLLLDQQHEALWNLANELRDTLHRKEVNKITQNVLAKMAFFVIDRFKSEERIMTEKKYPFSSSHLGFHENFSAKLIALIDHHSNSFDIANEAYGLIFELIQHHILSDDTIFLRWLEGNGGVEQLYNFKKCNCCKKVWETLESFLADSQLKLNGYQADFESLSRGILLFTHITKDCHTTISISIERFSPLADDSIDDLPFTPGLEKCPGHCLTPENLENCINENCHGVVVRRLIQKVIKTKKEKSSLQQK